MLAPSFSSPPDPGRTPFAGRAKRADLLAAALIVGLVALAYASSFGGAFVFDDLPSIVGNESLRSLTHSLRPPAGFGHTIEGRPLLNFSFAFDYALSGTRPWSYHATNLLIHAAASLALFGVLRRTLSLPANPERRRRDALPLSTAIAAVWAVHPLQTAAVTYVVQRAESLCGLCYLLTLLGFLHYHEQPARRGRWLVFTTLCCLAGMATKEVMATAPLLVLAYDRIFLSASWPAVWKQHGRLHVALGATWILLAVLVLGGHARGGTVGFDRIDSGSYFLTQLGAITHYLRLAFWPHPLVFDYGRGAVRSLTAVWPAALLLLALGVATIVATFRRRPVAFAGAWFFIILAPSSSFLPIATETAAEHRMYLPLAAVITVTLLFVHRTFSRNVTLLLAGAAAVAAVSLTYLRNQDYRSPLVLWADTARHAPDNPRAQLSYGAEFLLHGEPAAALVRFREALRLDPTDSDAHNNLADALRALGRRDEALAEYTEAIRLDPANHLALANRGALLAAAGKFADAERSYTLALAAGADASVRVERADVFARLGRSTEAESDLRAAIRLDPGRAAAHLALGQLLARSGQPAEAESALRTALRLNPASAPAHNSLGYLLLLQQQPAAAVREFEAAVQQPPRRAEYLANLGVALARCRRVDEAVMQLQRALQFDPNNALAKAMLAEIEASRQPTSP